MKKVIIAIFAFTLSLGAYAAQKDIDTTKVIPFDRGIGMSRSVFVPKGTVATGASFSYNTYSVGQSGTDDVGFNALFGLLSGIKGNVVTGGVSPQVSYFVVDNLAVGGRFNYKRTSFNVEGASIGILDMDLIGTNELLSVNYIKDTFSGAVFARYFIPFGQSRRFGMFAELAASGGYAEAQTYQMKNIEGQIDKVGTHQQIYDFEIGVIPGICAFVTDNVALEVAVGLIGLNYQKVNQYSNQTEYSSMVSSGANYKINLLNLSFGISFYIPTGQHSMKKLKEYKSKNS